MIPSAPVYVLESEESYSVGVTTSFHAGRVYKGNITIQIYARPINSTPADFRFIKEEVPPWVLKQFEHYESEFTNRMSFLNARRAILLTMSIWTRLRTKSVLAV